MAELLGVLGVDHWRVGAAVDVGGGGKVEVELLVAALEEVDVGKVESGVLIACSVDFSKIFEHGWSALDRELAVEDDDLLLERRWSRIERRLLRVHVVLEQILCVEVLGAFDVAAVVLVRVARVNNEVI